METQKRIEMVPAWPNHQPAFIFPRDFVSDGRQNCKVKARFTGNQSKQHWCHYSIAVTLCNQSLLCNDTLKGKKKHISFQYVVDEAKVKSCTRTDLQCSYALNLTHRNACCQCKKTKQNNSSLKTQLPRLAQSSPGLCKARKTMPIWHSLEQIRIVSTVGFYLFKRGRWIDNHHMPFWGPITQLCVKLENLFSQSSNGCSGH